MIETNIARRLAGLRGARRALTACVCLFAAPLLAAAQPAPPPQPQPQPSQGPMIVQRVENGFAIAPDFKVTEVNKKQARLAGAYGGWVFDNTLLVGAGGYWMTNQSSALKMAYGGAVVEWLVGGNQPLGFSARGLIGGGRATVAGTAGDFGPFYDDRDGHGFAFPMVPPGRPVPSDTRVNVREAFFVAEPQADLLVKLTRKLRLDMGVGYRLIGGAYNLNNRLRGPSGSVALQIRN